MTTTGLTKVSGNGSGSATLAGSIKDGRSAWSADFEL
jgi:hypothetical protein